MSRTYQLHSYRKVRDGVYEVHLTTVKALFSKPIDYPKAIITCEEYNLSDKISGYMHWPSNEDAWVCHLGDIINLHGDVVDFTDSGDVPPTVRTIGGL